jgi:DNA adenine methylase
VIKFVVEGVHFELIYADPPYLRETRTGGKLYQHEMTLDDHATLLEALDQHTGAVVLSGYPHPLYDERLTHWTRVTAPAVAEHGNKQVEVLWLNRHAAKAQQLSLFAV